VKLAVLHHCTADTPEGTPGAAKADRMMRSKIFKDYAFWLLAKTGLENSRSLLSTNSTGHFSLLDVPLQWGAEPEPAFRTVAEAGTECTLILRCLGSATASIQDAALAQAAQTVYSEQGSGSPCTHLYAHRLRIDPVLISIVLSHVALCRIGPLKREIKCWRFRTNTTSNLYDCARTGGLILVVALDRCPAKGLCESLPLRTACAELTASLGRY